MENFSTRRVALVPRLTNLLTIAVVLGAMGWSGAHRPVEDRHAATLSPSSASEQALPVMLDDPVPAQPASLGLQAPQVGPASPSIAPQGLTQVKWSQPSSPAPAPEPVNGLQTAGYIAASRR